MNPNQIASEINFQRKRHLHNQRITRQAWRMFARAVLIFGCLWAVAILFVLGWLAIAQ